MAKRALVIANSLYDDERFHPLPAAAADAFALAEVLSNPAIGEFTVEQMVDVGQRVAMRAIESFFSTAKREDLLVLHLSLHGWKDLRNRLHFIARDTERDLLRATAISAEFVSDCLSQSKSGSIVVLLDCCYSGAFTVGMLRRGIDSPKVDIAEPFAGRGRVVMTASTSLQFSHESESGVRFSRDQAQPSLFTAAVVQGLSDGSADLDRDGLISVSELYEYVHEEVRRKIPSQTPTLSVDSAQGTIYLARNPGLADPPQVEIQFAPDTIAKQLSLGAEATVVKRHQKRRINGILSSLETSYYPISLVSRGARQLINASDISQGVVRYLEETLGIKHVRLTDTILVRPPDMEEAALFNIPSDGGTLVFEISRVAFSEDASPIRVTVTVAPTGRNKFAAIVPENEIVFRGAPTHRAERTE